LIRGKTGRVWGALNSLFVTLKGLPMAYNRDLQEDKMPLFEAADQVNAALEMARTVIDSTALRADVPAQASADGWLVATDLAEALARAGTPFHRAHQLVGKLVLESLERNRRPADWTPHELAEFAPEFTADFAELLDPIKGMATREIPGGTGPSAVASALADARRRLEKIRET
jgi:argininosuccinate lyase